MKCKSLLTLLRMVGLALVLGAALVGMPGVVSAQGPEGQKGPSAVQVNAGPGFSYQGYLDERGVPVNGTCRFVFSLFDSADGGNQLGLTQEMRGVDVVDGAFAVVLNEGNQFGDDAFNGQARWLEITVGCGDGHTTLSPRHQLLAVPYAHSLRPGALLSGNLPPDTGILNLNGGGHGLRVLAAESDGVHIDAAGGGGVVVDSAQGNGVYVHHAGGDGVAICAAGVSDPPLLCATDFGHHGVEVGGAAGDGIHVVSAGRFGGLFGGSENQIGILDIGDNSHVWKLTANQTLGGLSIAESVYPPSDTLAEQSRIHIEEGGNVGIGTIDPRYRLSVMSSDHQLALIDQNDNEKTWTLSTVNQIEGYGVDQGIGLYEDGQTNRLFVASGGNVSIGGITNPLSRLSVNGDIRSRALTDSDPDLILGGTDNSLAGDDGIIGSDPVLTSSDIILRTNDSVRVDLDYDDNDDDSDFEVWGNEMRLFSVDSNGGAWISDDTFARVSMTATAPTENVEMIIDARGDGINRGQLGTLSNHGLVIITNDQLRMVLGNDGHICIGSC